MKLGMNLIAVAQIVQYKFVLLYVDIYTYKCT